MARANRRNPNHVHAGTGEAAFSVYGGGQPLGSVFGAASTEDALAAWLKVKGGPADAQVVPIGDPPPAGVVLRPSTDAAHVMRGPR